MSDNNYPEIDDIDFYKKIYNKKEFNMYKINNPIRFNTLLNNHQSFLKNYISPNTPYSKILLMHKTGTGKTLSSIAIAENYIPKMIELERKIIVVGSAATKIAFWCRQYFGCQLQFG